MQGRERAAAAMSSTTAGTYPAESVSSCHAPTPPPSSSPRPAPPAPAPESAIHGGPLRRRFDYPDASSGGAPEPEEEDDDEEVIRVADYIERAPQCVCRHGGRCEVQRDEQRGRWVHVCPAKPKCNHVSVCEEVGLDPEPSNNCVVNISSNHVAEPETPINNVDLRGAGATTPINNVDLRGAGDTTPNIVSPQATIPKSPLNSTFQSAGTSTPLHVSPKGPSAAAVVKISPQEAGSNYKWCKCNAGKCIVLRKGSKDYYVCPIRKGHGACSYMVPVVADVNEPTQTGTSGDKHLEDNLVEKEYNGNNLDQAQGDNANGSVNPPQPDEKEVHENNLVQAQDNNANRSVNHPQPDEKEVHESNLVEAQDSNANGSVSSQSDDEWPFEVVDNEIVPTAQTTTSAEVCQASPCLKCEMTAMAEETTAMVEAPTESPVPPYDTSSPVNPRSGNRVSPTGRILQACGELMISCCSGLCSP